VTLHLKQYRSFEAIQELHPQFKIHTFVFKNVWYLTIADENLFFYGLAWQDFRLQRRASCT